MLMFRASVCLFPAAGRGFPETTDIHHFGSDENPKYSNYHNYVSDFVVSENVIWE